MVLQIPLNAFNNSPIYNVLDNTANLIHARLDTLPPADQTFHANISAGTPNMMNSAWKCALFFPMSCWYIELMIHYPDGINIKGFYDAQLTPIHPTAEWPNFANAFTWWRHVASQPAGASHDSTSVTTSHAWLGAEQSGTAATASLWSAAALVKCHLRDSTNACVCPSCLAVGAPRLRFLNSSL